LQVLEYYRAKRAVPSENLVMLKCSTGESISRAEFERTVARPIKRALMMPGWAVRARCILLTMGIPLRISASPMNKREELEAAKTRERIRALRDLIEDPSTGRGKRKGYRAERRRLERKLSVINHRSEVASVDSELTLVKRYGEYELDWWIANPLYLPGRGMKKSGIRPSDVLMVSRLDAPDLATVRRMIDDGIFAEKNGLSGTACFDCRYPAIPDKDLTPYQLYDKWLRIAAETTRQRGIRPILDTGKAVFPEGSCKDVIFYSGWYSLARYVDAFTWRRGAVAYHIASGECTSLHGGGRQWCPRLLEDGACVTLGPVAEPYVQAFPPPHLFFRLLFRPDLSIAEAYTLSCPYLSWQMVLVGDPLYRPFEKRRQQ